MIKDNVESASHPIRVIATDGPGQPERTPELEALYRDFESELLIPLWTEISNLMPKAPDSPAVPHVWRWDALQRVAARAGELVPVGRGGERRAIVLANPGLAGRPFATPTLWAAIQYLNARESAPVHRHSQHAFRFVVSGSGVSTVVNGDVVPMRRGDFLPQSGWNWHSHVNDSDEPMAWIDGLDIPLQRYVDSTFFEPGVDVENRCTRTYRSSILFRSALGFSWTASAFTTWPHARHSAPGLSMGSNRCGSKRAVGHRSNGHAGHRFSRACGRALYQPNERWRCVAHDSRRVSSTCPGCINGART